MGAVELTRKLEQPEINKEIGGPVKVLWASPALEGLNLVDGFKPANSAEVLQRPQGHGVTAPQNHLTL